MINIDLEQGNMEQEEVTISDTYPMHIDDESLENIKDVKDNQQQRNRVGCSAYCYNIFYWVPLRQLCLLGNFALFIFPFLDSLIFKTVSFGFIWFLYAFVQFFALIGIIIELPTFKLTRKFQLKILFYCRFLRRSFGRGIFYITGSILTFTDWTNLTFLAGLYMFIISFMLFIFSLLSAKQLHSMYNYMKGVLIDNDDIKQCIINTFNQLDLDKDNKIGSKELHLFSQKLSNRKLSNAERHTIQLYLDCSCCGYISSEDWIKQFINSENVRFL